MREILVPGLPPLNVDVVRRQMGEKSGVLELDVNVPARIHPPAEAVLLEMQLVADEDPDDMIGLHLQISLLPEFGDIFEEARTFVSGSEHKWEYLSADEYWEPYPVGGLRADDHASSSRLALVRYNFHPPSRGASTKWYNRVAQWDGYEFTSWSWHSFST